MRQDSKNSQFVRQFQNLLKENKLDAALAMLTGFNNLDELRQNNLVYAIRQHRTTDIFPLLLEIEARLRHPLRNTTSRVHGRVRRILFETSKSHPHLLVNQIHSDGIKNKIPLIQIARELEIGLALPALIELLFKSEETKVLKECMLSIAALGNSPKEETLAGFLHSSRKSFVHAAVAALVDLGSHKAILSLFEAISGNSSRDKLIIAVLAFMAHPFAIDKLNQLLDSPLVSARNMTIEHLSQIGIRALPYLAENLSSKNDDVVIHSLTIMKQIGSEKAIPDILRLLAHNPANANIRFAAYEALGFLPSTKSAIRLTMGLEDPEEQVRLAAAKAIDNNISSLMINGLKNLIAVGDSHSTAIVESLLNARADRIFYQLIDWQPFHDITVQYLATSAAPEVRKHYQILFAELRRKELLTKEEAPGADTQASQRMLVYAIDDSSIMLNLYSKKLHELGHIAVTFQDGREAVSTIREARPDVVITDLNMPEIDGLQVTAEIRKVHSAETLPIIMITTQSDFRLPAQDPLSLTMDEEELAANGLNCLLYKPFTDHELASALNSFQHPKTPVMVN